MEAGITDQVWSLAELLANLSEAAGQSSERMPRMQCSSCNAEIGTTTAFCPFCGREHLRKPSTYGTTAVPASVGSGAAPAHSEEASTLKMGPEFWGLPKKYESMLAAGTKPEAIISELVRHNLKMRIVLEGIMQMLPSDGPNRVSDTIKGYLQSHCIACGTQTKVFAGGATPLCADCADT